MTMKFLLKIIAGLSVFLGIILLIMGNIDSQSPLFKSSIESVITETTGQVSTIHHFNYFSLFPTMTVDFSDLEGQNEHGETALRIEKFYLSVGFWDAIFGTGVRLPLSNFLIEVIEAQAECVGKKERVEASLHCT